MAKKTSERKEMENTLWKFGRFVSTTLWCLLIIPACYMAYNIRLYAINTYGRVIHEFDPWFNMRATRYLRDNGWQKFFHWFDYKVWYPLGRPVGTTIYPGMQIASVSLWNILKYFSPEGQEMSLNDVCVFVPVWFGVTATIFLGLLTSECTGSYSAGVVGASIMAIIPAHIMRSVGGGYDNESVAMTAMMMTFYFWVRSLRDDKTAKNGEATRDSYIYGTLCGFAYIFMVATWGGFIFVLNLIAAHAVILVLLGRYSSKLHRAYSLFYIIGTIGATHVPVVGWGPLKSMEQLSGLAVFCAYQILEYCEIQRRKKKLSVLEVTMLRVKVTVPVFGILALLVAILLPTGYFGPLTARIRGLFVKHTRTGNPLVDSVAEHQPASEAAYGHYLNVVYKIAPYGLATCVFHFTDANLFLASYAMIAYYFSSKMSRLIILLGPVGSALAGNAIGIVLDHCFVYAFQHFVKFVICGNDDEGGDKEEEKDKMQKKEGKEDSDEKKGKETSKAASGQAKEDKVDTKSLPKVTKKPLSRFENGKQKVSKIYNNPGLLVMRVLVGVYLVHTYGIQQSKDFFAYCHQMAEGMSGPSIMFKARLNNGKEIIVDDYREAYWWLRDKTPDDARVLAWWDYGYQITGIGNRTSLADGNTWNHEHIATLGRMLSGPEKKSHRIIRHLADYVLVWAGGGGDDLAKSPHMARIGNSVYSDICPGDPTCSQFGFYQGGVPTPMMRKSLLYKLTQYGYREDIKLDPNRFMHVKTTKYGKVRIFKVMHVSQKSKKWIADPENRVCDAPGSWYCTGQYPPALSKLIARRKDFSQLEDFNKKKDKQSEKYNEEYMKRMDGKSTGKRAKSGYGIDDEEDDEDAEPVLEPLAIKYVGCYGGEDDFGGKEYIGSSSGANIRLLHSIAKEKSKKYIAIARVGSDGHSFIFDEKPGSSVPSLDDRGCGRLCVDDINYKCGCADANCDGVGKAPGEEHLRRWVVYEMTDKAPEKSTSSKATKEDQRRKKKKKKKEQRKKKDAEEAEKKVSKKEEKKKRKKKRKEEKKKKKKKAKSDL
jgi:dolichyl-diphosphooligosaccharide---protein glycosyltransferase